MAPIPLKAVISVSSEDKENPATNLLSRGGGSWLSAPGNRTGVAEVVLQLSKRARITSLEICNAGSAFVEVLVSNSDGSADGPSGHSVSANTVTLLNATMLMTVQESRSGRNKSKTVSYSKERLSAPATASKWNTVKLRCMQKFNLEAQFGLRSVFLYTDSHGKSPSTLPLPPSLALLSSASKSVTPKASKTPPSRLPTANPLREHNDFEFSGVEKQSRLFRDCLQNSSEGDNSKRPNKILDRIVAAKEQYKETLNTGNQSLSASYQKRKLLKKELPKAAAVMTDFVASYKDKKGSIEMSGACRRMSSHDNDYELGDEPEKVWEWGRFTGKAKRRGRRGKSFGKEGFMSGWLNKRKKLDDMIEHCSEILSKAGSEGESKTEETMSEEVVNGKDCDSDISDDDTIIYEVKDSPPGSPLPPGSTANSPLVECPLCLGFFPSYAIQVHASQCGEDTITTITLD